MNTITSRALAMVGLAVLVMGASVASQTAPSPILSPAEVQQLIASSQPMDHARLRAHFTALAEKAAAETKQHESTPQSYARNGKLAYMVPSITAHCKKLADTSRQLETSLRTLASDHGQLAGGAVYQPPVPSTRSAGTATAGSLSDTELADLAARATSAADHQKLEQHFAALAARYEEDARNHNAYAKSWRATTKVASAATIAAHCDRVADGYRDAAKEAREVATMHKDHAAAIAR